MIEQQQKSRQKVLRIASQSRGARSSMNDKCERQSAVEVLVSFFYTAHLSSTNHYDSSLVEFLCSIAIDPSFLVASIQELLFVPWPCHAATVKYLFTNVLLMSQSYIEYILNCDNRYLCSQLPHTGHGSLLAKNAKTYI